MPNDDHTPTTDRAGHVGSTPELNDEQREFGRTQS